MSLRLGSGGYARRTGAANLGSTVSGTWLAWYRKEDNTVDNDIAFLGKSGSGGVFRVASSTQIKGGITTDTQTPVNMAANSWAGIALVYSEALSDYIAYFYQGGVLTTVQTYDSYAPSTVGTLALGDSGAWSEAALGSYRYARYWTRALSALEIQAEFEMTPSAGTPAASLTNLYLSWPLATGADTTDWSGSSRVPTISGGSTSADEPPIGGSASPAIVSVRQSPARPLGLGSFGVKVI